MKRALKRASSSNLFRAFLVLAAAALLSAAEPSMRQTLEGDGGRVYAIAYSPDGKRLASGGSDNAIRIWDLKTGETLQTLEGHTDLVYSVAFSPDGTQLASGGKDGTMRVWNAETGEPLRTVETGKSSVFSVDYSPDGTKLAGSGGDGIHIWNAETEEPLQTIKISTGRISYSPDGTKLASSHANSAIRIWDAESGALLRTLKGHVYQATSVNYSPDGTLLASSGFDRTIRIWDAESGALLRTFKGSLDPFISVEFSPDGKMLVSEEYAKKTFRVWDVFSGAILQTYSGHKNSVECIVFSPDGASLASGSNDKTIQIWDAVPSPSSASVRIEGEREHGAGAFDVSIVFSESMRGFERSDIQVENGSITAFSGSGDFYTATIQPLGVHTVRVWVPKKAAGNHIESNAFVFYPALRTALKDPAYNRSAAFSPDGSLLASAGAFARIRIRKLATGETIRKIDARSSGGSAAGNDILFSPDGSLLAFGNRDILIWDAATSKKLHTLKASSERETVRSMDFSPDGSMLASGGRYFVRIWNVETGEEIRTLTKGDVYSTAYSSVAFSPDGKTLAGATADIHALIHIWDSITGERIRTLKMSFGSLEAVVFSPDSSMFAGGGEDDVVRIWSADTGEELRTLTGHTEDITCAAFSPDGSTLASGSRDGTVRIWNPATGETLQTLEGHLGEIRSVAYSSDGSQLAVCSGDVLIRIWNIVSAPASAPKSKAR